MVAHDRLRQPARRRHVRRDLPGSPHHGLPARDVDGLADHGAAWFRLLVGTKTRSVDVARSVVETAVRVSGGSSYGAESELSRLYRDALAGLFHPSDPESAHATVANHLFPLQ